MSSSPRDGAGGAKLVIGSCSDRVREVVELAIELIRIPSVTNCPQERLDEVRRCADFIAAQMDRAGLEVRRFDGRYPALVAGFPGALLAPVTLCGHFDVVRPEPDDRQFAPRVDGDRLWGRGSADMKTVVASDLVWMFQTLRQGPPYPPVNLLLVGNEENGETDPCGTPHVLEALALEHRWQPELMLVGERTGERGDELFGQICPSNRGIARLYVRASGPTGHSGTGVYPSDLLDRLIEARSVLTTIFNRRLTLNGAEGWESTARFPFLTVGEPMVYNITAGEGYLGVEIRPIPEDDIVSCVEEAHELCSGLGLELVTEVMEAGITCPSDNPHLGRLLEAMEAVSGQEPVVGRKKPGSSARFAPGGNAVVWGETGYGPHSPDEWHFIPSIEPYLKVLDDFAARTAEAVEPGPQPKAGE